MNPPSALFDAAARAVRAVTTVYLLVANLLFVLSLLALGTDVVLRYGFNSSIEGLHEAVLITFVYVFLLGAAAVYARNEDIAIEFLFNLLPERGRRWAALLIHLAIAATMAVVLTASWTVIESQLGLYTSALRLPVSLQMIPLAFASASIIVTSLVEAWACAIWIVRGVRPAIWSEGSLTEPA